MNLFQLTLFALVFFFGTLAILMSIREERLRKKLVEQDKIQKQKIFQVTILKEIQDRIGYSLDVEEIIGVITASLKHIFPYSAASSLVIKQDKLIFKTEIGENVSKKYVEDVKQSMLASLKALISEVPEKTEDTVVGLPLDDTNPLSFSSFFHIPLIVGNEVGGIINISSTKPNLYREDEMTILYQITAQASQALTKLREVLETEKGKLTSMIASLQDGVFMLDKEKNVLIINDAARRFLNLNPGNLTFFDILTSFPKEYDLLTKMERVSANKMAGKEEEIKIASRTFSIFITPVISSYSRVIGLSVLLQDITLQKNLSEIKEDFTNMMVHELRAPLTNIKDASSLVLTTKLDEKETSQFINMIHSQAKVLLSQVSDLLDASKIEAGKFVVEKSEADLGKIIQETLKTFLPQAEKKQVLLSSHISPLPPLLLDQTRITQVINNLLSNSLKFTNARGEITIFARQTGAKVEVAISDTGIGIPKDKQKDLFSKFYQVAKTAGSPQGTGLGLYLVKGVIEAHNGNIYLDSEEGKGTTISFTLPLQNLPFASRYRILN